VRKAGFSVESGVYVLHTGGASDDLPLSASFRVQ
jgi:hypothetical protein